MANKNLSTENIRIKEALAFQPLSEEEKKSRGILCRLYGPCASFVDPTRNERFYDEELWDNVFNKNEIVREMFEKGGIPMELDHPEADRDETKSMNIAAILPERPKKDENGHLIAYVDILDTPAGRIAYTLAKYGFQWGISSRGSGDLYTDDNGNEAVDPETYDFQTFDLVLLPAVKEARLNMTESFNNRKTLKIKKARKELLEAYTAYGDEEKLIMKQNLKKIGIKIDENVNKLTEDDQAGFVQEAELPTEIDGVPVERIYIGADGKIEDDQIMAESLTEDAEDDIAEVEADEADADMTLSDFIDSFKDIDDAKYIEFETVDIDGVEYYADVEISEETDDAVILKTVLTPVEDEDKEDADDSDDEDATEAETIEDEADDDGADEMVESMKKLVRQNKLLESKIKTFNQEKTVSDAEVEKLTKELNQVKSGFARTSELAAEATHNKKVVESLKATLAEKEREIANLKKKVSQVKVVEKVDNNSSQVKLLKENLAAVKTELADSKKALTEQVAKAKADAQHKTELATKYKAGYISVLKKFVESKADMLGVTPADITCRLPESYTITDIENVCNTILNESRSSSSLPYGRNVKVKINESAAAKKANKEREIAESGFEIDDWLKEYI